MSVRARAAPPNWATARSPLRAARTQAAVRSHASSNLVEESLDVAVQIGQLPDASVIARFASEPDWHKGWGEVPGLLS